MCARAHVERWGRQDSLVEQLALERCLLDGLEEVGPGGIRRVWSITQGVTERLVAYYFRSLANDSLDSLSVVTHKMVG